MSRAIPDGVSLAARAERVPNLHTRGGRDTRTAAQYHADLAAETERLLLRSPSWRAGRPLADHTDGQCDCPATVAGCVERRPWPTSGDLGSRNPGSATTTVAPGHGLNSAYRHGCRCQPCRDAAARYQRALRARHAAEHAEADGGQP